MRVLSGELCAHRICMKHLLLASFISSLYTEMTLTITPLHQKNLIANKVYNKYHIQKYMALHFLPIYNCFYWCSAVATNRSSGKCEKSGVSCFQILDMVFCIYFSIYSNKSAIYLAGFIG